MKLFEGIDFLKDAIDFQEVKGGHSNAQKFSFLKHGKKYFIKIKEESIRKDLEQLLTAHSIPHAKVIEIGQNSSGQNYIIEEFLEYKDLADYYDVKSNKDVYEYGFKVGEKYYNLRKSFIDKAVDAHNLEILQEKLDRTYAKFEEIKEDLLNVSQDSRDILLTLKNFYEQNTQAFEQSLQVFGCTDFKPRNFLLSEDKQVIAVDFEQIKYFEISTSLRWGLVSGDINKFEKYLSFTSGYLEGLFQFDVPVNVLKAVNVMFAFMVFREAINKIRHKHFDKAEAYLQHSSQYIINGEVDISGRLINFKLKDNAFLKGARFEIADGSFDDHNRVFKCVKDDKKYFLKIMDGNEKTLQKHIRNYEIIKNAKVPTANIFDHGVLPNKKLYVIFEYIEGKEWNLYFNENDFESGFKHGLKVANTLKPLWKVQDESIRKITADDVMKTNCDNVELIYASRAKDEMPCDKQTMLFMLEKFKKSFENEPLHLIHADIKYGNIMSTDGDDFYIIDNESLCYSHEIINFRYNLDSKFLPNAKRIKCGFLSGYLHGVYGETMPKHLHGQIKFTILSSLLNLGKHYAENRRGTSGFREHRKLYNSGFYEKEIQWLT